MTPSSDSDGARSLKNGITMTRDFEVVEMSDLSESSRRGGGGGAATGGRPPFAAANSSYAVTTAGPLGAADDDDGRDETLSRRFVDSFKRAPGAKLPGQKGFHHHHRGQHPWPDVAYNEHERHYDVRMASARTVSTGLSRELKGRHLQMIAIGGSIGTFFFSFFFYFFSLLQFPT